MYNTVLRLAACCLQSVDEHGISNVSVGVHIPVAYVCHKVACVITFVSAYAFLV